MANAARAPLAPQVRLADGIVEGVQMRGEHKHVRVFRGIPYAAPPVNEFRFREPQPVARWAGVLNARQFGPRCMQGVAPNKLDFRSKEMSEDCLYLNVWTSARGSDEKRPVLVYFHGGGFVSGDGSEPRYDGASLAARGVVAVTLNYRLGVFGFLAPPDAASESPHGTAGNYGLLDQVAALRWVRDNIAQFGGDPSKVTIAGNSAGSVSVSAHMASPLSRGLFARAIGESGGAFAPNGMWRREEAEEAANRFAARVGARSLQQLRSLPARTLLNAATLPKLPPRLMTYRPHVDGHFLTDSPEKVFANGQQAQVPLLVGSNSQEQPFTAVLNDKAPSPENWRATIQTMFQEKAEEVLAHYPGNDANEVMHAATALAGDFFIGHSAWRWMNLHRQTGQAPVYYYRYTQPRPIVLSADGEPQQPATHALGLTAPADAANPALPVPGAEHNAQVEYALGNLKNIRRYAWTAADYDVSRVFSGYIEQFVKTGSPNGTTAAIDALTASETAAASPGSLPAWPAVKPDSRDRGIQQLIIGEKTHMVWDRSGPRHGLIERIVENGPIPNGLNFPIAQ
ncbi:carboxylesterase family protein [Trinickia caryophylli]|nr:carboxylesterase family protein [Trinickia caryophylli]